jgi:hypothetical protein
MKMMNSLFTKKIFVKVRSLAALSSVIILFFTSCTPKPLPYSILEFEGNGEVYNYSKSPYMSGKAADSINRAALIAYPGDLIMCGESFFTWKGSSQLRFTHRTTDSVCYINDKISSVFVPENEKMIQWFKQMNSMDLSQLEFLVFGSKISENYFPYLSELAKTKPDLGLAYSGDLKDLAGVLKIFNPRIIIGGKFSSDEYDLLSGLTNLEILSATLTDSLMRPLPVLPRLRQLNLMGLDYYPIINDDFLINNNQLENLIIMTAITMDFSVLKPLSNLKELFINGCDSIENFDLIKDHKQLEVLVVFSDDFNYRISPKELSSLRWITFTPEASQIEFDSFIASHPNLEVVEIANNKFISGFDPLLNLRKLYGLTIRDTLIDFKTLLSLKNLKYLSLPEEVFSDSLKNEELKRSLPNTRLIATHGACLGSGWLLLIFPLVLLFSFIFRMKYDRTDR